MNKLQNQVGPEIPAAEPARADSDIRARTTGGLSFSLHYGSEA